MASLAQALANAFSQATGAWHPNSTTGKGSSSSKKKPSLQQTINTKSPASQAITGAMNAVNNALYSGGYASGPMQATPSQYQNYQAQTYSQPAYQQPVYQAPVQTQQPYYGLSTAAQTPVQQAQQTLAGGVDDVSTAINRVMKSEGKSKAGEQKESAKVSTTGSAGLNPKVVMSAAPGLALGQTLLDRLGAQTEKSQDSSASEEERQQASAEAAKTKSQLDRSTEVPDYVSKAKGLLSKTAEANEQAKRSKARDYQTRLMDNVRKGNIPDYVSLAQAAVDKGPNLRTSTRAKMLDAADEVQDRASVRWEGTNPPDEEAEKEYAKTKYTDEDMFETYTVDTMYDLADQWLKENADGMNVADFQVNGTRDQWYDFVNSDPMEYFYEPYYEEFGDLHDRKNFDKWFDFNQENYTFQGALTSGDYTDMQRVFGDDASSWQAVAQYLAENNLPFQGQVDPESGEDTLWYWTEEDPQNLKENVILSNILLQYMNSARNSSKERTGSDIPTFGGLSQSELSGITNALGYGDVKYNDFADPDVSDNVNNERRNDERWMNLTGVFDPWEETDVIRAQDYGDNRYYDPMGTLAQWGFDFRTDALPEEPGWSDMLANYQNYLNQQQEQGAA